MNTKTVTYNRKGEITKVEIEKGIDHLLFNYKYYTQEDKIKRFIVLVRDDGLTIKIRNEEDATYYLYYEIYLVNGGLE